MDALLDLLGGSPSGNHTRIPTFFRKTAPFLPLERIGSPSRRIVSRRNIGSAAFLQPKKARFFTKILPPLFHLSWIFFPLLPRSPSEESLFPIRMSLDLCFLLSTFPLSKMKGLVFFTQEEEVFSDFYRKPKPWNFSLPVEFCAANAGGFLA